MKTALVMGATGFIGMNLCKSLMLQGYKVIGIDRKGFPIRHQKEFTGVDLVVGDLTKKVYIAAMLQASMKTANVGGGGLEIYQLAADMGGAGYIFTGKNDYTIMANNIAINLNLMEELKKILPSSVKVFYSSSACVYPAYNQTDPDNPKCSEDSAYPAAPDSEYGWEKLMSERMWAAFHRMHGAGTGVEVHVARFHNIYGPYCQWDGGREKAPAAIARKVLEADKSIEIWGDGEQTRSFLYVDDCIKGIKTLMESHNPGPVNIGSEEMVTINKLAEIAMEIAGKSVEMVHIEGPLGVRGRNSYNHIIESMGWKPEHSLRDGMKKLVEYIKKYS